MFLHSANTSIYPILQACIEASNAIMEVYGEEFTPSIKLDGSPVTLADKNSNKILVEALQRTQIPIISEESHKEVYDIRRTWNKVWIVDPLDGTKEFIKKNGEFVICIALVENNSPILGIICSPVNETILIGGRNIQPCIVSFTDVESPESWKRIYPKKETTAPIVVCGSRSHHNEKVYFFHEKLKNEFGEVTFLKKGSALKFFDLAQGISDVYPRLAPTMEWDIAAGQAIIEALGGEVVNLETGKPLTYNKEDLLNPFFVVNTCAIIQRRKS